MPCFSFAAYLKQQVDASLVVAVVALRVGQTLALILHLVVEERVAIEGALHLFVERVHVELLDAVLLEVLEAGRVEHADGEGGRGRIGAGGATAKRKNVA